jgi:hypothetical protein
MSQCPEVFGSRELHTHCDRFDNGYVPALDECDVNRQSIWQLEMMNY